METLSDKARAWTLSLALHLVCFGVLILGTLWTRSVKPPSVRGSVIEAVLVAAQPPSAAAPALPAPPQPQPRETAPPPQPEPEPRPQQAEQPPQPQPQTQVPRPDRVEAERVARLAREAEQRAQREQAERRRQEQVLLEEQRKQEEAENRERLTKMEEERQAQLEDIRRQREQAEREREQVQRRLAQVEQRRQAQPEREAPQREATPQRELGNEGTDDSLEGRYALAIQQAVERSWIRPETVPPGQPCVIRIIQIPGGEVINASVDRSCPYDELGRRSVEAAVLRAQPLPYQGFESVFSRELTFTFRAPES
ncbi:MAG TPA: cell envelope integrity protein TolA [Xanthomonadaceae bacterium]|nr:cell envelope integrity protein TolA [Xanthomonadaceae bacterium]